MKERRRYVRFPLVTSITYILADKPDKKDCCLSRNISGEGINLYLEENVEVGDKLTLKFSLPLDAEPIEGEGEVIWINKHGERGKETGVKFVDMPQENIARIDKYITRCLTWD